MYNAHSARYIDVRLNLSMNIPNLPTDNLYKFLALSGVVISLFFNIYPDYVLDEIREEVTKIETESGELKLEVLFLEEEQEELEKKISKANTEISRYQYSDTLETVIIVEELKKQLLGKENRDYLEFIFKYKNEILPAMKLKEEIRLADEKIYSNLKIIRLKSLQVNRKLEIMKEKNEKAKGSNWMWALGSGIGVFMMITGFRLWYTRVQKPLDQKLINELSLTDDKLNEQTEP